jgi:hypothetical protein
MPAQARAVDRPSTRACSRAGTRSYMTAPRMGFTAEMASPPTADTPRIIHMGLSKASTAYRGIPAMMKPTVYGAQRGNRGLTAVKTRLPTTAPAPKAAKTNPIPTGEPSTSLAHTGTYTAP